MLQQPIKINRKITPSVTIIRTAHTLYLFAVRTQSKDSVESHPTVWPGSDPLGGETWYMVESMGVLAGMDCEHNVYVHTPCT